MGAEPTDAREMLDHELNEVLQAHPSEELDGLSVQNQRLARIQEYEEAAVSRSDPFAAVIGMGNAYLQRVFEHLGAAILDEGRSVGMGCRMAASQRADGVCRITEAAIANAYAAELYGR